MVAFCYANMLLTVRSSLRVGTLGKFCYKSVILSAVQNPRHAVLKEHVPKNTPAWQTSIAIAHVPNDHVCAIARLPSARHFVPPATACLPQAPLVLALSVEVCPAVSPIHAHIVYVWDTRVSATVGGVKAILSTRLVVPCSAQYAVAAMVTILPRRDAIGSGAGG